MAFAVGVGSAAPAEAALANPGSSASKSQVRLLSAGGLSAGAYDLGLGIALAPGVSTYWSFPGDAGVPPTFDFAGSINLAAPQVSFPAPERIVEDGATTFGWRREVLFPLRARPLDPARPARLEVDIHYATCDVICVPAEARETVELTPRAGSTREAAVIALWRSRAPAPLPARLAPSVARIGGGKAPSWRVAFPAPAEGAQDLFVVGADGWFFSSRQEAPGVFDVVQEQKPAEAPANGVPATLTFVNGSRAWQIAMDLEKASPARLSDNSAQSRANGGQK